MAHSTIAPSLNFLRQRRHKLAALRKQDKVFLYVSAAIFSVIVVVAVVLAGYLYLQKQKYQEINQADTQITRTLSQLVNEEAAYLIYSNRLKTLATMWTKRGSQQKTLAFLAELALPNVSYQQITFDQSSRLLQFSVLTGDYFAFEDFVSKVKTPEIQARIESFSVGSVRRNDEGKYTFSVDMTLKEQS